MALQDYVKDDQYDNRDHRNGEKSMRDPYLRHENKDHEPVNNRNVVNDLMSIKPEDKSRKRQFRRFLRVLAVIVFLGLFICLTVFFFIYDFEKSGSEDVIFVGNSNTATIPSNTLSNTAAPDENKDITPITKSNSAPTPTIKVTPVPPAKKIIPASGNKVASNTVQTGSNNIKKQAKPTNQQAYFYDNFSQYDYTHQYDNHFQYEYSPRYNNNFQYEDWSRYDNNFRYEDRSRYDNHFRYEDLFKYEDNYRAYRNIQPSYEISGNYLSYSDSRVSFPESFKQREVTTGNSVKKSYPVIGERAYNEYLEKNLRKFPNNACGENNGKIILMFKVNAKGRPFDIAILRSLCQSIDEEAIRLLEGGSNWTPCDNYARLEIYL